MNPIDSEAGPIATSFYVQNNLLSADEQGRMDVEQALHCMGAETEDVGHWPTVANVLGEEVYRLRKALEDAPLSKAAFDEAEEAADAQEYVHREVIEALLAITEVDALRGSQPQTGVTIKKAIKHLRNALALDAQIKAVE